MIKNFTSRPLSIWGLFLLSFFSFPLFAQNHAPVAGGYQTTIYKKKEDIYVLTQDYDIDGNLDTTSYRIITPPRYGQAVFGIRQYRYGVLEYTPSTRFSGKDTVSYAVCDKGIPALCDTNFIEIDLLANRPPLVSRTDFGVLPYQERIDRINTVADFEDARDALTFKLIKAPSYSDFTLELNGNYRIFFKTPDVLDTLIFSVCDSEGLCTEGSMLFIVAKTSAPKATPQHISATKNQAINNYLDIRDGEFNFDSLTAIKILNPTSIYGSFKWFLDKTNMKFGFNYTPKQDFLGVDSINYQVCDKTGLCDSTVLTLEYLNNNPPTAVDDIVKVRNNYENYSATGEAQINDFDVDYNLDTASFRLISPTSKGQISMTSWGFFQYFPSPDFTKADTASYQVCDKSGLCDTAFIIFIKDTTKVIDTVVTNPRPSTFTKVFIEMLVNTTQTIANGRDSITISQIICLPNHGFALANLKDFTYMPQANYIGLDSFCVRVCNTLGYCDTILYLMSVKSNTEKLPIANDDFISTTTNTTSYIDISKNDTDNGSPIVSSFINFSPLHGTAIMTQTGTVNYTPTPNFYGTDKLGYIICNIYGCDSAFVYITVQPITPIDTIIHKKSAPLAHDDFFTTDANTPFGNSVAINDTDADNDLTINGFKLLKTMQNGTLSFKNNGDFLYTPNLNFMGSDSASYAVCDSTFLCDTAMLVMTVKKGYHAPSLEVDIFNNIANTALQGSVALNDTDVDNDLNKTSFKISENPMHGKVKLSNNGQFIYLPDFNFIGKDTFSYMACDSRGVCSETSCIITTKGIKLSGRMFIDENRDGIMSANEQGVANALIQINDQISVFTNETGYYALLIDTSKIYTLSANFTSTVFNLINKTRTVKSSDDIEQVIENQDFIVQPKALISDLAVNFEQGNARPGFASASVLTFSNKGTTTLRGTLKVKLDTYLGFEMADKDPLSINGNTLSWYFADLKPFEVRRINIISKTAVRTPLTYETSINFSGLPSNFNDTDTSNNAGISKMQVKGSFDPNDIKVDITKVNQIGYLKETPLALTYTIRFQNTGNAEAYRVEVVDTLSEKLDMSTLEMVAVSHPFEMLVTKDNASPKSIVKWVFDNINLVDSTTKEACSHGFVKYRINNVKSKTNYAKDSILNKAAIFFDFNDPVLTDTATTYFNLLSPTHELNNLKFQAYPNPTAHWVTLNFDKEMDAIVETHNVYGQLINHQILRGSSGQVNLSGLSAGIYYITVKSDNKVGTMKIMKR
jgi:Bacterial Ig domain/Secretion system C-terminal sorting domain